jgi:hypothetical protein
MPTVLLLFLCTSLNVNFFVLICSVFNTSPKKPPPKSFPPKKESSEPLEDKIYKHIDTIPLELKGKFGKET